MNNLIFILMEFSPDSTGRWFDLAGQVFLDVKIFLEDGRQNQIFWLGE
jgi:hypothetical protein